MSDQKKLEDLFVDEEDLNEELLVETVGQYAQIGKETGDLIPKSPYNDLDSKGRIIVALLAQKARFELDLTGSEWLSPGEISDLSGVKKNTVYPSVRELTSEGILRDEDGEYRVPSVNIEQAKEYLAEG